MVGKFSIFLLALCAMQSATCKVIHVEASELLQQRIEARGVFDQIEKFVDTLLKLLKQKLNELELSGNVFIDKVEAAAISASQNVTKIVDTGISLIQAAAQQVIDNGLDATKCLGTVIEGLEDLKGSTINDLTKCSTDRLATIRKILHDSISKLRDYVDDVEGYLKSAKDCGINIFCLGGVFAQASIAAIKMPVEITYEIAKCNGLMALEMGSVVACTATELKDLAFIVGGNVADTTKCLLGMTKA